MLGGSLFPFHKLHYQIFFLIFRPKGVKPALLKRKKIKNKVSLFKIPGGLSVPCSGTSGPTAGMDELAHGEKQRAEQIQECPGPSCSPGHSGGVIPCILPATKSLFVPMGVGVVAEWCFCPYKAES